MFICIPLPIPFRSQSNTKDHTTKPHETFSISLALLFVLALIISIIILFKATNTTSPTNFSAQQQSSTNNNIPIGSPTKANKQDCVAPLIIDPLYARQRKLLNQSRPKPRISIIYVTKRPGGYDILLNSLAQQKVSAPYSDPHTLYELICVDELAPYRAQKVYAMAEELGVNVAAVVPSKPKARAFSHFKFGIYNALNTALLFARGDIATFVMDLGWIPSNFIQRTLEFYDNPIHTKSFLAYPEIFYHLKSVHMPKSDKFHQFASLTIFDDNMTKPFSTQSERFGPGMARPEDMSKAFFQGKPMGFEKQPRSVTGGWTFWELSFATCPFAVLEELNGVEERFDYGDDCHENNIRLRSEFIGYDLWIDGATIIENLWHKNSFDPKGDRWNRYDHDSIQNDVLFKAIDEIRNGQRGVRSEGHDFDLKKWRELDCPLNVV